MGAAREVTGSCYLLSDGNTNFLVDCGLHQGGPEKSELNVRPFPFDPGAIDFVILTHAHIDHSGLVPRLVKKGFRGPIHATQATADLAAVLLRDSGHVQEMEAEWRGRKARRAGRALWQPAYTEDDARRAIPQLEGHPYGHTFEPAGSVAVRFRDAGHILGSSVVEIELQGSSLVFSGDLGQPGQPIIRDPETGMHGDFVVMESTYGDRLHERREDAIAKLSDILKAAKASGGNVVIPSFAVGRTQELIYFLRTLCEEQGLDLPVYVDSPLASEATAVYKRHKDVFDEEAAALVEGRESIFQFSKLHYTTSAEESRRLNGMQGVVIISSSGMAEAGRIKHHLKHNLWKPECHVVIVGYQAEGTLGRRIRDGASVVRIFGEEIAVRARVHEITGLSAHADREQLLEWAAGLQRPRLALLTHGEPQAAFALQKELAARLGWQVVVPTTGQEFQLKED
jgi:metallo-beta-lactamase family protein